MASLAEANRSKKLGNKMLTTDGSRILRAVKQATKKFKRLKKLKKPSTYMPTPIGNAGAKRTAFGNSPM